MQEQGKIKFPELIYGVFEIIVINIFGFTALTFVTFESILTLSSPWMQCDIKLLILSFICYNFLGAGKG
jgi:hypothetical protein